MYKYNDFRCTNEMCECKDLEFEYFHDVDEEVRCSMCYRPMEQLLGAVMGRVINPAVNPGKSLREQSGIATEAFGNALKKLKNKK